MNTKKPVKRVVEKEPKSQLFYKSFLVRKDASGKEVFSGPYSSYRNYSFPVGMVPGKWQTVRGAVSMCHVGFHVTTQRHLATWHSHENALFLVEVKGRGVKRHDKSAFRSMRILYRISPEEVTRLLKTAK